jgi:thymidylate synthase
VFNLAEVLWFLGGRDDLAMMRYYAPRMAAYSPDGITIAGAAYGTRLFRTPGPGRRSPFDATLDLIREDPDTKRAISLGSLKLINNFREPREIAPTVSCTSGATSSRRSRSSSRPPPTPCKRSSTTWASPRT